ncbi:O-antigen ligase family protein [Photobacterium toruni]|uniref:O-Antigen ligase n=1 Tax=Photobacterium toruni TaxID=1935446 RepID=A0A1T4S5Q1_9GAMM|nr:O-antigen ligase family protein [Photobacterium toruni]SKA23574.1 O-Antigen ligase [Photobacterium toruni]
MLKKHLINGLILLPFIWLSTGIYLSKDSDKTMVIMILVSIVTSLMTFGIKEIKKNIINNRFIWLLLIIFSYLLFSYFYHGVSSREIRALIASLLLLITFPHQLLNKKTLLTLTVIGSITGLIFVIYFSIILKLGRGDWPLNAIPFSTITTVYLIFSIVFLLHCNNLKTQIIISLIVLINISSLILSETRGTLLAGFIAIIFILLKISIFKKINLKIIITSIIILSGIFLVLKHPIEQRIEQTAVEYHKIEAGNLTSSIGLRLQLWDSAPMLIKNNILLGVGNNIKNEIDNLYKKSKISQSLYNLQPAHLHNQYLDKMVKNGVLGLVLFISLLLFPIVTSKETNTLYKQLSLGVVIIFSISSLTDVPFNHGQTLFTYLLFIGVFNMFILKNKG